MLYPKIPGPFMRHTEGPLRNKLNFGLWSSRELELLADLPSWTWTEKVDGTNIRVVWDGHRVQFGGRTDAAAIPAKLIDRLRVLFPEELLEQVFGKSSATLFGEGYGAGIQKVGGGYSQVQDFILFDVAVPAGPHTWWLERETSIRDVANALGVRQVPYVMRGSVIEAIKMVARNPYSSVPTDDIKVRTQRCEGYVGVAPYGLVNRAGDRITVKVKYADFAGVDIDAEFRKLDDEYNS